MDINAKTTGYVTTPPKDPKKNRKAIPVGEESFKRIRIEGEKIFYSWGIVKGLGFEVVWKARISSKGEVTLGRGFKNQMDFKGAERALAEYTINTRQTKVEKKKAKEEYEKKNKTFDQLFELYLSSKEEYKDLKNDITNYRNYIQPIFGGIRPVDVEREMVLMELRQRVNEYRGKYPRKNNGKKSPKTHNNVLALLKKLSNFAQEDYGILPIGFKVKRYPVQRRNESLEAFEDGDLKSIWQVINKRQKADLNSLAVLFLILSGRRLSELYSMRWRLSTYQINKLTDVEKHEYRTSNIVDVENQVITYFTTKNNEPIKVHMSNVILEIMKKLQSKVYGLKGRKRDVEQGKFVPELSPSQWVFPNERTGRKRVQFLKVPKQILEKADIDIKLHRATYAYRHTFSSTGGNLGFNEGLRNILVGQTPSEGIQAIYTRYNKEGRIEVANQIANKLVDIMTGGKPESFPFNKTTL